MKRALLSIAVFAVVALAAVFQMQPVRADSATSASPGKPTNVSAGYQGESSISVSWNASPNEATGILYEVFYRRHDTTTWTPARAEYSGATGVSYRTDNPIVVPTLGEYQVRVKACNYYVGSNIRCNYSAIATVQVGDLPAKPKGLTLTQAPPPDHDINVTWKAVTDADKYSIRWRAKDGSLGDPIYATTTRATISLDEYDEWVVRVEACNDAGCGKPASGSITTSAAPPKPTGIVVTQRTTDYSKPVFRLEWDPVPGALDEYAIYATKTSGERVSSLLVSYGKTYFSYESLAWWWKWGYGEWTIVLTTCNSAACTLAYIPLILVPPEPPANPPTGLTVSQTSKDSLRADVEFDIADRTSEYKIRWRKAGPGNELNEGVTLPASAAVKGTVSTQITLDEYASWVVRVEACNGGGCSAGATTSKVSVEGTTPALLSNYQVKDSSVKYSAATASWDEDPHATHYEVKWRERRGGEFSPEHAANVPAGQTSIEDITLPSAYNGWVVRARACNVNLCGPAIVDTVSVTIFIEVPVFDKIQNLDVHVYASSLEGYASWKLVPGATYYKVWHADTLDDPSMVPHITTNAQYFFDLPAHGTWDFLVQGCNDDDGCFAMGHELLKVSPEE